MKIATKDEIKAIDRSAVKDYGMPSVILMENAGEAVFRVIQDSIQDYGNKKFVVFCGTGNNGGDGAVVARKLFVNNIYVQIVFVGDRNKASGDNKINFDIAEKMGIPFLNVNNEKDWDVLKGMMIRFNVAVDALLGVGFHGKMRSPFLSVIHTINSFKEIIAVDIPSGLYAEGGMAEDAVKATHTVTFGLPKSGMVDFPELEFIGELHVAHINLPRELLKNPALKNNLLLRENVKRMFPVRKRNSHKGDYGHLAIIQAQNGMAGATQSAGLSALRAGAGLVTMIGDDHSSLSQNASALMRFYFENGNFNMVDKFLTERKITTLVIGPGLGISGEGINVLKHFITNSVIKRLLLDADALNILSKHSDLTDLIKSSDKEMIFTPHIKEMARLMHRDVKDIKIFKADAARDFAAKYGVYVVLKDAVTVIATPDGEIWYDQSGNDSLAKGGSGDVLAGLIAGLWVSGASAKDAALAGSYVLGKAGEAYAAQFGTRSALSDDIIGQIPSVFADLESIH